MPENKEKYLDLRDGADSVLLLPSVPADARALTVKDRKSRKIYHISAALCGAKFLREVRGLPLDEMDIETGAGVIRCIAKGGRCFAETERFSLIERGDFEGERVFCLGSPLGKIRRIETKNLSHFSSELIRQICLSREGEDVIGALAVERRGGEAKVESHYCKAPEFSSGLVSAIAALPFGVGFSFGKYSVLSDGVYYDFEFADGRLFVSDRHTRPLTLYAPEID